MPLAHSTILDVHFHRFVRCITVATLKRVENRPVLGDALRDALDPREKD
jgi:hypothetical protein